MKCHVTNKVRFAPYESSHREMFLPEGDRIAVITPFGFPAGHGGTNYPLLMGEKIRLTVDQKQFKIKWNRRK